MFDVAFYIVVSIMAIIVYSLVGVTYAKVRGPMDRKACIKKHGLKKSYSGGEYRDCCGFTHEHGSYWHSETAMFCGIIWPVIILFRLAWALISFAAKAPIMWGALVEKKVDETINREEKNLKEKNDLAKRIAAKENDLGLVENKATEDLLSRTNIEYSGIKMYFR